MPLGSRADKFREAQTDFIQEMNAERLASHPYHNEKWHINREESEEAARELKNTVRLYYSSKYIKPSELPNLIVRVPFVCIAGDSHIVTQDQVQRAFDDAKAAFRLISNEERRLSRNKCTASVAKVYATGGYKTTLKPLPKDDSFECIVISGAGPQFEAVYLDYADFIITPEGSKRLSQYAHLGEIPDKWQEVLEACKDGSGRFSELDGYDVVFHRAGYLASMTECMHLWLTAFNDMVTRTGNGRTGYMKISAIGAGFFSDVADIGINIAYLVMPLLQEAVEAAIMNHTYSHIAALEFPDFSGKDLFRPRRPEVKGIKLIHAPRQDVMEFSEDVRKQYVLGILNPGDCFACVGNELGYSSVESMIGNNSTIRTTQCYIWNECILDERNYISVEN